MYPVVLRIIKDIRNDILCMFQLHGLVGSYCLELQMGMYGLPVPTEPLTPAYK